MASFDDLPDELVVDILSRLPVKTVVESTSVSKLWYSLIKNPSFISAHLSRSVSDSDPSNNYILLIHDHSPLLVTVVCDNYVLTRHPDINLPFENWTKAVVIGICNGLICLTDWQNSGRDFHLTNPSINKYKKLGAESSCYPYLIDKIDLRSGSIQVSFGYSKADNDYKIFRVLSHKGDAGSERLTKVEIYSLNTGSWKGMDALVDQVPIHCSPAFVNGCLYWLPETADGPLVCFDFIDEVFSKIKLPAAYAKHSNVWSTCILEKNGLVAIYIDEQAAELNFRPPQWFCFLVLEKDNDGHVRWEELYYNTTTEHTLISCIGFSGRFGRVIHLDWHRDGRRLAAVDLDNSIAEKLPLDYTSRYTCGINVMESLVMWNLD